MKKKVFLFLILLGIGFLFFNFFGEDGGLIKPQLLGVYKPSSKLESVVTESLKGTKGTYAVVIKKLGKEEKYELNKERVFETGSLYKLWVMGTTFEKIEKGEIKEDEILSQKVEVLNEKFNIDPELAERTEGEITLSVSTALNQMITISHNYAALLLLEKVKTSQVAEFMKRYGLNYSAMENPPTTTASDTAFFLEKLYKGEIVSKQSSEKMLELLKKQQLNDGLPKLLPKDTAVAHKTGDLGSFKHDGGIVFTPLGDYIIVVLSESESPAGAQIRIANLSKTVYEYFTK